MKDYVIPVNPFETRKEAYSSISGIRDFETPSGRRLYRYFPAGEVSNRNNVFDEVLDKEWEIPALKLIKKQRFQWFRCISIPRIRASFIALPKFMQIYKLLLPSEMMKKRDKPIRIRIGKPVSPKIQEEYESVKELGDFLRKKVYMMKSYYERRKSLQSSLNCLICRLNFR